MKNNNLITMKQFTNGVKEAMADTLVRQMACNCAAIAITGVVCLGVNAYRVLKGEATIEELADEVSSVVNGEEA